MTKAKAKKIETRKDEVKFTTSDPGRMLGKYLTGNLRRTWQEDFIDEDTGEIVPVERSEIIMQGGGLIDAEKLARIQFHLQSGDITEVEVSNQQREAFLGMEMESTPWSVTAMIGTKKRRFLLYARSAQMALEIAQDYIELHFAGLFYMLSVKVFDYCIFIKDSLKKTEDDAETDPAELEFYKIEIDVVSNDENKPYTFVLQTKDVDTGMIVINKWIADQQQAFYKDSDEVPAYQTTVKSGVVIPCYRIIEKEFSQAYINA